ncbi:hypothetical protein [Hydrogenophaga sp. PBL-H3]|uniref:hypothetical protein n=1 Tax=Hydrogenophaga sp. PBL-H3 TaxID=434010 RepID=UPI0013203450|nr:hypothetical protein [Hydrogenophaga sp. PBL-H3]QHE77698.1 hypothetical protein F9Z45_17495 [Hydrogenophaga sp. PBL-H3]QHE82122.1 hypothetical protein F9Z44_17495 [Hydrogenophaga sp. PBL-H3]
MKRSSDTVPTTPPSNRRALLLHHVPALLADPDVAAFLDGHGAEQIDHRHLERRFVLANEPALLLELIRVTRSDFVKLDCALDGMADPHSLPDGLLEYVVQHLPEVPWVTSLMVASADLTAPACARLQALLQAPGCTLTRLSFANCHFADPQVRFPTHAPTVQEMGWVNIYDAPPAALEMSQFLPAATTWTGLEVLRLMSLGAPINFGAVTQVLLANQRIRSMFLASDEVPAPDEHPAPDPQTDPALLFNALKQDRTGVTQLTLRLANEEHADFDDQCLQLVADCLATNTTLQALDIPGIQMCSGAALQQFTDDLWNNHTVTALAPLDVFNMRAPAPIRRNQAQHFRFTAEFILGSAEAFMRLMGTPRELGTLVGTHLAPTPVERVYCGPVMALLCKATHASGVQLRSACLREALKQHIRSNDSERCRALINTMVHTRLDLLPPDKAEVVALARARGRLNLLPPGYAG